MLPADGCEKGNLQGGIPPIRRDLHTVVKAWTCFFCGFLSRLGLINIRDRESRYHAVGPHYARLPGACLQPIKTYLNFVELAKYL